MWKYKPSFIELVMIFFLIGALGFGFVRTKSINNSIEHCSVESKAIVIDVYRLRKRGYFMKYKYVIDGVEYFKTEGVRTKADLEEFSVGGTIDILYACEKISYSKYLSSEK